MIQAVVFDYGGVLTRSERTRRRLLQYDARLGWPPGKLRKRLFAGEAWELASTGAITPGEHWARVGADLEDRLPPSFRGLKGDPFFMEPLNGNVVALARRIHLTHRLALCSNALPSLVDRLQRQAEIAALFEVVIVSSLVGLRKPDQRIFELTAKRLGLPIDALLLVDDKERNVRAAREAGMAALRFRSAHCLEDELGVYLPELGAPA